MKGKTFYKCIAAFLSTAMLATAVPMTMTMEAEAAAPAQPARVSVHDPSIIKADGKYYVFGSHLADAKSDDLITWTQMNPDFSARGDEWKNDSVYGEILVNFEKSFQWAGYDDGDTIGGGLGFWAPDVIYNPDYEWADGTKGAYMLYYSATSTWKRSCIGYAVSKTVEGPYSYVDTIIYSGFTEENGVDHGLNGGFSDRDTKWDNDYLNLSTLIKEGVIDDISDNWFQNGQWNEKYAPNAIDPTVFYSKDNNLFMVYGSWSGGLFIQELDKKTGNIRYPGTDWTDVISKNNIDRYFGTHIAGGNHQSGEGAYILYDAESDYYYLYESYGHLWSTGGYNMRLFRSKDVYGPYLDAAGNNAKDSGSNNDAYGIKLIGNYAFSNQQGYRAAGHNSALIDDDGQRYLIYHQRFEPMHTNDMHELRVHQQYLSEDGWPVTAVYEYRGEQIGHYEEKEVFGSYELVNHGTGTGSDMLTTQNVELKSDGTVIGDVKGTWSKSTGTGKAYDYLTMELDGVTYKGIFYKQYTEGYTEENPSHRVMTFSVVGSNNTCLWGSGETTFADDPPVEKPPTGNPSTGTPPAGTVEKGAQVISAKSVYTSVYGKKPFSLNAKLEKGNGALSYSSDNRKVADVDRNTGKVTIKGMGTANITITASETDTFKMQQKIVTVQIAPKKMTLTYARNKASKKVTLKWKTISKVNGYQIQYSEKSNFKKAKTVTLKSAKSKTKTIAKLKKKTYYFRVRAYVKSGKTPVYGEYSKPKKVKVK